MDQKSLIKAASIPHIEHEAIAAGREAERLVEAYLDTNLDLPSTLVWHDIRIPRDDGPGKYEVDFLIASPYGMLLLEVKNFGGSIDQDARSGQWIQTSSTRLVKQHECPIRLTGKKIRALRAFLMRNGISCLPEDFHLRVVMTNPRVRLAARLKDDGRICALDELPSAFELLRPRRPGFLGIGRSKAAFPKFKVLMQQLDRLPTWDEIRLYGGKILRGDIQASFRTELPQRAASRSISFLIPRHWFWGHFHPCLYFYRLRSSFFFGVRCRRAGKPQEGLKIQLAGQHRIVEVKLYSIERISYGSEDESYYRT